MKLRVIYFFFLIFVISVAGLEYFAQSRTDNWFYLYTPLVIVLGLLLFFIYLSFSINNLQKEFEANRVGFLKNLIEILAILFAGFFFVFHFVAKLDTTDASLELKATRQKVDNSTDKTYLAIDVKITNGSVASAKIHSIKAYIYKIGSSRSVDSISFHGYERLLIFPKEFLKQDAPESYTTYSDQIEHDNKYTIAANESTQFGACKVLNDNDAYRIEVAVILRRKKFLHDINSQFRASAISLPVLDSNK